MVFFQQKRQNHCNCDKCTNIQGGGRVSSISEQFTVSMKFPLTVRPIKLKENKMKKPHGKLPNVHPK